MIKVVQIQYSTASGGNSAARLHTAFLENGVDSTIISLQKDRFHDTKTIYTGRWSRVLARLDNKIQSWLTRNTYRELDLFSYPIFGHNVAKFPVVQEADIIYVHWVQYGFLSLKNLKQLAKLNKPVIFILHDMWMFTGGCHYSFSCEKYISGCNTCPVFKAPKKNDLAAKEFKRKLKFYSAYHNLFFVTPSSWLCETAKRSLLLKVKTVLHIPNVIDRTFFKPLDKNIAKGILNIDTGETVLAFGAVSITNVRKGWQYLQEALQILGERRPAEKITIAIFGSNYNPHLAAAIPFKTKFLGYLKDVYSTALVYNAADVFILPSLADNLPTTIQESLCCGTPVVGFNTGGIPEMITHKQNGYLARYKDAADIAEGIAFCLDNNVKGKLLPQFEKDVVLKNHMDLFKSVLPSK